VGCGRIALGVHIPALLRIPLVTIAGFAEPDPRNRDAASRLLPRAEGHPGIDPMLDAVPLDALLITSPNAMHAGAAIRALERRIHTYVEKPLATSLDDGRAVLRAWRKSTCIGMIGFNYRFNPLYEAAREYIQSGRLGEIVAIRSVFSLPPHETPAWKRDTATGGGVLFDLASHHIDLVRHLSGSEVESVLAKPIIEDGRWEAATLEMRLTNSIVVQSFFSLAAVEDDHLEIYGRAGKLRVDRHLSLAPQLRGATNRVARREQLGNIWRSARQLPYLWSKRRAPAYEPSYEGALRSFVAAIRAGRAASPDLLDGYQSLAVVHAALESAAAGPWTEVNGDADSAAQ
jgi:predicted dehydrogenase